MDSVTEWSSEPVGHRWCDMCNATQYVWLLLEISMEGVRMVRYYFDCLCCDED